MSKKTKWRTELPEGSTCPICASMRPIFSGRGRVISGLLEDRFGSRFGTNTNLLGEVIGPKLTRIDTVFDDIVSLLASHADVLRGFVSRSCPTNICWIEWLNSFPIVRKYEPELTCRLLENQSALFKSKCSQAIHIRLSSVECDTWSKSLAPNKNT